MNVIGRICASRSPEAQERPMNRFMGHQADASWDGCAAFRRLSYSRRSGISVGEHVRGPIESNNTACALNLQRRREADATATFLALPHNCSETLNVRYEENGVHNDVQILLGPFSTIRALDNSAVDDSGE